MGPGTQGPASLVGQIVGGYRLVRVLGKGATGVVFLGQRLDSTPQLAERTRVSPVELPNQTAIKILILPWQLDDEEREKFRKRFLREAETLAALEDPHILPIILYGDDEATNLPYMILPYLAGGALQDRLARQAQPMPLLEVKALVEQIAGAVDHAHNRGVIHRDIKPGNILLDSQGQAYLSDFSVARLMAEATTRLTRTGLPLGTPIYMAPEALTGEVANPASDIYSLGMVVYEMVCGLRENTAAPLAPPLSLRSDLPEPAGAAIMRALDKDPAKRFATATDFAQAFSMGLDGVWDLDLASYVTPAGGSAASLEAPTAPYGPSVPAGPAPRRAPWGLLGAAAALLLVVACVAGLLATGAASPLLAVFMPRATASATGAAATTTARSTTATGSVTPGAHATATAKGSSGGTGGTGGTGGGGGGLPGPTATAGPPVAVFGDGSDGPLTISSSTTFQPLSATCSGAAGSTSLNFANASSPFAFLAGKPVLIIQSQGAGAGAWMKDTVTSSPGATSGAITLQTPLNADYSAGAQVIVLKEYTDVTVNAGVTWSAPTWNGSTGGILAFLASGTVTVNGTISANGRGFRAGLGGYAVGAVTGGWGEDQTRSFVDSRNNNDATNNPGAGVGGGGGAGNQGGSGGNHGGGGGGGYGAAGGAGVGSNVAGGLPFGVADLTSEMIFGGGGGGGGASPGNPGFGGGSGGAGGGIVFIAAGAVSGAGSVVAYGFNGSSYVSGDNSGGGGGGAGGSVLVIAHIPGLGGVGIAAGGGAGGPGGAQGGPPRVGGDGGTGRVWVTSR